MNTEARVNDGSAGVTREEIENALLTTGVVDIDAGNEAPIVLGAPRDRRLAEVVLDRLRSSPADDLARNTEFFDALEAAFVERRGDVEPESGTTGKAGETEAKPDPRSWRLKKVETRGFGGLNAASGDIFEFDAAGRDFCIEGQNGSGKSSLANAVLFAMTGKVHRDQYGFWDDPARSEPVMSDEGAKLGDWPPIAAYPDNWQSDRPPVDVSVRLTFGNETDDEEIEAARRLYGEPGALQHEASIDPGLTAAPALIEAALLMPMRIQHIRVPETDDNGQLVGLIRQLIGLEPLIGVADLVDKLTHGNQRFLKYARNEKFQEKANGISRSLQAARERIEDLDTGIDLAVEFEAKKPAPDNLLKNLGEAKKELDRRQADGFRELAALAFDGFDPGESEHRRRVADAIDRLHRDSRRQSEPNDLPPVLGGIASLARRVGEEGFAALKSALRKAAGDLDDATEWAGRQKEDVLLRLKAVAAGHFEDGEDPLCPLCEQSIGGPDHRDLVEDLRALKADAERAQTRLADACRRIEEEVESAARHVVPDDFMRVGRFAVKRDILDRVRETFVDARHVSDSLPGFINIARTAVDSAFGAVEEFEFGSALPEPADGDEAGRVRRLLDHLGNIVAAAENWPRSRQAFRDAWPRLFSENDERSLTARILQLKGMIEGVEPFRSASENVGRALEAAAEYNAIVGRQALREEIAQALKPLRRLRDLVNLTTRRTIDGVSDAVKEIHGRIYNPETLAYEKAGISEYRGRQSLTFQARLGNGLDWRIDAALLANMSWMRGVLWSFVFAIRERAIERSGRGPFELMVLDDPQMTFDTRNLKGWARFLGRSDGLRRRQPCQLLVTTHNRSFALEMTVMPDIRMAGIETGQSWSSPAQVVTGDFAEIRFQRMMAEGSDDLARGLIADIRTLAETLLKHAIESFDPAFVCRREASLGRIFERVVQGRAAGKPPYTDTAFGDLMAAKSSHPDRFRELSEAHHSVSETITVREAREAYRFWKETLFPAVRKVWEKYRFLQEPVVGEAAAIPLPANCNHRPLRSAALASARPAILGRVSAYSDGRAASAVRIDRLADGSRMDLGALAAYRLEKDTLSPVARIGDILLTRLDARCRASNLIVEDRGAHLIARRWHEGAAASPLAILAASSSNPREVPAAVVSQARGANRRKIVGVLFAAGRLQPGDRVGPDTEATALDANNRVAADLVAGADVFEVQGGSAEPIALDKQYLLAKSARADLPKALDELDGRPVIAEDGEGSAFFKRLRMPDDKSVILESLDKTGSEGPVLLSVDPAGPGPVLTRIREVVGVVFDRL